MKGEKYLGIKFSLEDNIGGSQRTIAECLLKEIVEQYTNIIFFTRTPGLFSNLKISGQKIVKLPNFKTGSIILNTILLKIFDQLFLEILASHNKCKAIYFPYNHEAVWKTFKIPQVVTIHDLIPLIYPDQFPKLKIFWKYFNIPTLRRAQKIIAVSSSTKQDLIKLLGINEDKIAVVYNGFNELSGENIPSSSQPNNSEPPYFFYLSSSLYPYKNLKNLVLAFSSFLKEFPDYKLIVVGKQIDRFKLYTNQIIEGKHQIELQENVSNERLQWLFKNAAAFIYPSFYEGFGIPPLEAMQFGIPVGASNAASIPEVCGNACIYFDPESVEEILNTMRILALNTETGRNKFIDEGYNQISKFSWKKSAAEIINICNEVSIHERT